MKKLKLFGERISPACRYCVWNLSDSPEAVCCKQSAKAQKPDAFCRKFCYDPLRRIPKELPKIPEMNAEDFQL